MSIFRIMLVLLVLGICLLTAAGVIGIWSENDVQDDVDKIAKTLCFLGLMAFLVGGFGLLVTDMMDNRQDADGVWLDPPAAFPPDPFVTLDTVSCWHHSRNEPAKSHGPFKPDRVPGRDTWKEMAAISICCHCGKEKRES